MGMERRLCPSCQTRVSPLAMECPTCGLIFTRTSRPRPLLFHASGLKSLSDPSPRMAALQVPALGRVEALPLLPPPGFPTAPPALDHAFHPLDLLGSALESIGPHPQAASFGPLLMVEAGEACLLVGINLSLAFAMTLSLQVPLGRLFSEAWPVILPIYLLVSWAFFMVPLVLGGQSPLMGHWNLVLAEDEPERRMLFSLLHLFSVILFPLSFLCMVLSPRHQTLAEYLSGQEIISRPEPRLR